MLKGLIFCLKILENSLLVFIFKNLHNLVIHKNTSQQTVTDICPTLDLSLSFLEITQLPSVSGMLSVIKDSCLLKLSRLWYNTAFKFCHPKKCMKFYV